MEITHVKQCGILVKVSYLCALAKDKPLQSSCIYYNSAKDRACANLGEWVFGARTCKSKDAQVAILERYQQVAGSER